jgi:hypothetical protein
MRSAATVRKPTNELGLNHWRYAKNMGFNSVRHARLIEPVDSFRFAGA